MTRPRFPVRFLAWWRWRLREATGLRPARDPASRTLQLRLALAAAALFLTAIALAPVLRGAEIARLSAEADALAAPAGEAASVRSRLLLLQAPVIAASARLSEPDALDTLRLLTVLLPDDVQLSTLSIDGRDVRITGTSRDARVTVAGLRRSGRFARVTLAGTPAVFEIALVLR